MNSRKSHAFIRHRAKLSNTLNLHNHRKITIHCVSKCKDHRPQRRLLGTHEQAACCFHLFKFKAFGLRLNGIAAMTNSSYQLFHSHYFFKESSHYLLSKDQVATNLVLFFDWLVFSILSDSWPELSTDAEYCVALQEGCVSSVYNLDVKAQEHTLQAQSTIQFLVIIRERLICRFWLF